MERENHSDCGQPKIMTIKTAKTITKSRPLVAACRDHSTTLRYPQTTLKLPSNYPQTTLKLLSNYPQTTPPLAPNFSFIYNQVLQFDICFVPSRQV